MGDIETDKQVQAGVYDVSASDERICNVCQLCIVRPHRARLYKSYLDCASDISCLSILMRHLYFICIFGIIIACLYRKHDKAASKKDITASRKKKIWQDIMKYRVG